MTGSEILVLVVGVIAVAFIVFVVFLAFRPEKLSPIVSLALGYMNSSPMEWEVTFHGLYEWTALHKTSKLEVAVNKVNGYNNEGYFYTGSVNGHSIEEFEARKLYNRVKELPVRQTVIKAQEEYTHSILEE